MKKRAFLFFPQDFLVGTSFMTNEEVGQYIRLLLYSYEVGPLTKNQIIHITGEFNTTVLDKFEVNPDGYYYHKRIEKERNKADTDILGFKFVLKEFYHKDESINYIAKEYSKLKKIHINPFQLADLEEVFKDKRFKHETISKIAKRSLETWETHAGSDKLNFKYLLGIFKSEANQMWTKHRETEAVRKKQAENKEIERDRAAAARLEEEETYNDEAKTPAFELADMLNKKKIEE